MLETVNDFIDADLTHAIHTSERKSFKGCRRRWDWLFRQYYYPLTTAKPLEFGVAFHKAMEVLYEPAFWGRPRDVILELAIQSFRQKCQEQLKKYETYVINVDEEVYKDYSERMELGESMLRHHAENILPEFYNDYKPLKVEVSFEVPIADGDRQLWCACDVCLKRLLVHLNTLSPEEKRAFPWAWRKRGLPVTYGGRIDCVMENVHDGTQWIFDWKTAAQLSEDRNEFLLLDDQISSYVWALYMLGIQCSGFVYVEQRKASSGEPEPMKVRRLGRNFSVSKGAVACSAETYEKTVSENDPEAYAAGLYDAFIEWLRENNKLHAVYPEHRNQWEIENTGYQILQEALDMTDPNLRIYPNAGRFSCGNCAFKAPCLSKNDGSDYTYALETMFEKRKYHYWKDAEADTDSNTGINTASGVK